MAVDDLTVEMPGGTTDTLHRAVDGVAGAVVETVAPADGFHDPMAALSLAATLAAHRGRDHVTELVRALPEALWASWSCGLKVEDGSIEILSTSVGAPPSIHLIELPWMPLGGPRRLPTAMWMPPAWQMRRYELSRKASHGRAASRGTFLFPRHRAVGRRVWALLCQDGVQYSKSAPHTPSPPREAAGAPPLGV